jgi:hypothetical protein
MMIGGSRWFRRLEDILSVKCGHRHFVQQRQLGLQVGPLLHYQRDSNCQLDRLTFHVFGMLTEDIAVPL